MKPKSYALYIGKGPAAVYGYRGTHTIMPGELVGVFWGNSSISGIRKMDDNGKIISEHSTSCDTKLLRILSPLELLTLQAEE